MSSRAVHWAWEQRVKPASTKLLLMAIADFANPETALAFPSVKALEEMTGLNRKTIFSGLDQLTKPREEGGLGVLTDTGKRAGRTQQIVVYRMSFEPLVGESVPKTEPLETGHGRVPISDGKSTVFTTEESRKRDTEPSIEPRRESYPPSPNGEGHPQEGLFGDSLPVIEPAKLEDTVRDSWNAMKLAHPGIAALDILSPARAKKISARAAEVVKDQAKVGNPLTPEQVWTKIFDQIPRSAFLTGRAAPGKGYSQPLKLTIDYVLRPSEFFKIWEGGYDDGEQHGPGQSFDAGTGRVFGEAEQAARRAIGRIQPPQRRRA